MSQIKNLCKEAIWDSYLNDPKNLSSIIIPNVSIQKDNDILKIDSDWEGMEFSDSKQNYFYFFSSAPLDKSLKSAQMTIIFKFYRILFDNPSNSLNSKTITFQRSNLSNLCMPYLLAIFGYREPLEDMAFTGILVIPISKNIAI